MPLNHSKSAVGFLLSTLLVVGMLFGVVQISCAEADSWSAADNVLDDAAEFFDDSYIHEIRLYFDDPDWYDTLYNGHDDDRNTVDPYFPARFVSHGIELDPIGARFKGYSTFGIGGGDEVYEDIKKPFRLDFNIYDEGDGPETTFFGLKKLNLNNGARDPSLVREKLFMDFASNYVPSPRSVYTRLYVNDEYFGLYLAMEHVDNTFVESRFGSDEDGNLYKAERQATLLYHGPDPESYHGLYELKNNEETNDWSDLIELTDVLSNTPISELPEKLEPILDVESTMYSLALLDLFVSLDSYIGYAHNYYLYDRSDTGQFTHLLWDANLAFGNFWWTFSYGTNKTIYPVFPPTTLTGFGFGFGGNPFYTLTLIKNVMAVEAYNATYLRALAQMLREGFDADSMNARVQELSDLIRDEVYNDPNLQTDPDDFEPKLDQMVDFVKKRAGYVDAQLNAYAKKTDIRLNDLMPINHNTIADGQGDYDPWVEIYNLGPGLVDTGRLFLTDDSGVPDKWALPVQDVDDGEFMLLWLDGEPEEGASHAPFSLNSSGGDLYLYLNASSGYVLVDSVSYPVLVSDVSYGRFPDGDGLWYMLDDVVTPAGPNQFDLIPNGLVINEFMANNDEYVEGPEGDYPDWIELYNGGTVPVDIGGMYLTDDLSIPDSWQFTEGTVIEAKGFLVVWADNASERGPLHTSFSLNATGESLGLFAIDGKTAVDFVIFDKQLDDLSYGKLTDGGSVWEYLTPTFGSTNALAKIVVLDGVFINEFMANNDAAVACPYGDYPDWIELYNAGSSTVNLSGMYLTGNLSNPNAWQFPEGARIKPKGFLVVWADNASERGWLYTNFSLNAGGEAVGLFAIDGKTAVDSVVFGKQLDDISYARLADGNSSWSYLTPTPGYSNAFGESVTPGDVPQPAEVLDSLFINEFMANNDECVAGPEGDYPDWVELYNGGTVAVDVGGMYLTNNLSNPDAWPFPANTVIEPDGFVVVWADNAPSRGRLHASFSLNACGEAVGLFAFDGVTLVDSVVFGGQLDDVSYGRVVDGGSRWDCLSATPSFSNSLGNHIPRPVELLGKLFINEFMANNDESVAGPEGDYPDWIELYNAGADSFYLGGMYLTDNVSNPNAWRFPAGTILDSKGFVVVWADNAPDRGLMHAGFSLNASGEEIGLFAVDGVTLVDSVVFGGQLDDVSYGRVVDGGFRWDCLTESCGLSNSLSEVVVPRGRVPVSELPEGLVINEFMANNDGVVECPEGGYPDWVELYNGGTVAVDVGGMYLTDDLDNPEAWQFPSGTVIDAGGFLVVYVDNSSVSGGLHANFALAANGEEIGLFASDGMTLIDSVVFTRQTGGVSYGRLPDGAESWEHMLSPTPGWENNQRPPLVNYSLWTVLLLVGLVGVMPVLLVAITKLNARRKQFNI